MKLTDDDKRHLECLDEKCNLIRDRVTLCAKGYCNGAYIWGEGGIGKSYAVINQLDLLGTSYILHNTRLSPPSLFQSLEKHPKDVHVAEDVENIFTERTTMNLVRSALWGQRDKSGKQRRIITYGVHPVAREFEFDGQIIFTGNRPLHDIPELRALATRIPVIHLLATRPELIARMKSLALHGYRSNKGELTPEMCCEVLDYLITVYPADRMYDIRILIRCFDDRIGSINLDKTISSSWRELVLSQVSSNVGTPATRQDRIARERSIALELAGKKLSKKELLPEWHKRTGRKTLDTYYRRLRKLQ